MCVCGGGGGGGGRGVSLWWRQYKFGGGGVYRRKEMIRFLKHIVQKQNQMNIYHIYIMGDKKQQASCTSVKMYISIKYERYES